MADGNNYETVTTPVENGMVTFDFCLICSALVFNKGVHDEYHAKAQAFVDEITAWITPDL